jgi:hypothetical protein
MKQTLMVVPFVLALLLCGSVRAEDKPAPKAGEWTGTVGCSHCNYAKETAATKCSAAAKVGDKVYVLTGEKVTADFKKGGDWTIKGTISEDGKSIAVTEMKKKE